MIDEKVYFNDHGPELPIHHWDDQEGNRVGQQLWPMQRWNRYFAGWDFNLDSLQHIGLLSDLIQDMRNVGVQWEQLGPLFRAVRKLLSTCGVVRLRLARRIPDLHMEVAKAPLCNQPHIHILSLRGSDNPASRNHPPRCCLSAIPTCRSLPLIDIPF